MIYLGIVKLSDGTLKLRCQRQDKKVKNYSATEAVINYARKALKKNMSIKADFDSETREINKVTIIKGKTNSYGKKGTSENKILEESVYRTAGIIVAGLEGVNLKNVKTVVADLYAQGLALVKGETVAKQASKPKEETTPGVEESEEFTFEEESIEE